jgi:hypothetical protein
MCELRVEHLTLFPRVWPYGYGRMDDENVLFKILQTLLLQSMKLNRYLLPRELEKNLSKIG